MNKAIQNSSFIIHHFLLAALLTAFTLTCSRETPRKPNVLLITLDTFRADRIGASTPNLAKLASRAVKFENADSPVPLTLPAHASILSATLPLHHGLRNNGSGAFPADRETLATLFRGAGYRTGAFVSSFVLDHRFGLDRGFDRYDDEVPRDPGNASTYDAERRGSDTIDRALEWLKGGDTRPAFTWVHLYDAHAPYAPPQPYPQTYDGEIAYVDAQVGRLLAAVDIDNTIVVVVGDHGESLGEHGELTHGLLLYEPTLHVPMLVAAPNAKARVINEPVSTIDLAPTIASLSGLSTSEWKHDGHDLSKEVSAADIYAETEYPTIFGWSELAVLRRGKMKYISSPAPELYDLARDPHETHNVLADERRTYRDLASRLDAMRSTAVAVSTTSPLDEEAKAKLASLGYIAPSSLTTTGPRADPKTMAPLFRQFEEATWALNAGRLDEAIAKFRPAVASDPRNPVFRASLARTLRQKGDLAAAITLYQESVAIRPDDPEAWYNLAIALQEADRMKEGGIAIREAVRRDPLRPEAHNALGITYSAEGDLKSAEAEFLKASQIDPHDARAMNNLGNVYRATGRTDEALAAYQRAVALAPRYADALNGLGVIAVQRDDPRGALEQFDRALAITPKFYEAQLNRGIALQLAGDRAGAAKQFRSLLAELPAARTFDVQRQAARRLLAGLTK
ncbi:MAG: choline-sulfatase [Acidobacteriota bacterium]|nr:choline-sulfatase [Acidobacteriota bacterium]